MLAIEGIAKAFGGLRVLADVSFDVAEGEAVGLIGPNGAGKTTLFNVITGFVSPDHGRVRFAGVDVTHTRPDERVCVGLGRTFQKSMVFPGLSARENIAMAARTRLGAGYRWRSSKTVTAAADGAADMLLDRAALGHRGDAKVGGLSYGEQRMVDVLIALAAAPKVLLLDEPTAGLAKAEGERMLDIVRGHDERLAIVLIAHDLDIVFAACDRVAVLDLGRLIAVDTPAAIRAHPGARAAYLGALAQAV